MTNNTKYILIALAVAGIGFFLWKKYKLVKKVA
ncbi:LPXTG cell wall anchor domain-containing protein [Pseudopedobacter beijingensis]|uniref:LPXTG cell wall anchor domain-containing protein n=1 Tax=Pseudopedobacter beijingensis TaxID=1207056 RepID=A0ABW4IJ74_9SPHI